MQHRDVLDAKEHAFFVIVLDVLFLYQNYFLTRLHRLGPVIDEELVAFRIILVWRAFTDVGKAQKADFIQFCGWNRVIRKRFEDWQILDLLAFEGFREVQVAEEPKKLLVFEKECLTGCFIKDTDGI